MDQTIHMKTEYRRFAFDNMGGSSDRPPANAWRFLRWVDKKLRAIPAEYRHTATIKFEASVFGDDFDYSIDRSLIIAWRRPETVEETKERLTPRRWPRPWRAA